MSALVEVDDNAFLLDLDNANGFHGLAIQLLRRDVVEAAQLPRQPAIATVGQDGHGDIEIDVQAHLAGQAVEVEEVDADAQAIFDAIAARIMSPTFALRKSALKGQIDG